MHSQQTLLGVALLLLLTRLSAAATIDTSTIVTAENSYPNEQVVVTRGATGQTAVQLIEGGVVQRFQLDDDSLLNVLGGTVTEYILTRHTSQVNLVEGIVARFAIAGDSKANIYGGVITSELRLLGSQGTPTLSLFDGQIDGAVILQGRGVANIHGGRLGHVAASGTGYIVNVMGGTFVHWSLRGAGVGHWSGGESIHSQLHIYDESVLHIYGSDWKLDYEDHYSGTLLDGTKLSRFWFDLNGNGRVVLHSVPEPTTFALACAAALPLALLMRWRSCGAASSLLAPASFSR